MSEQSNYNSSFTHNKFCIKCKFVGAEFNFCIITITGVFFFKFIVDVVMVADCCTMYFTSRISTVLVCWLLYMYVKVWGRTDGGGGPGRETFNYDAIH